MNPCGSGQRLWRNGRYGPDGWGVTDEAHDWSYGRKGFPLYCTHCAFMNELGPINWIGYPVYPSDPPEDFDRDPCTWYWYKDPADIPERHWERYGLSRARDLGAQGESVEAGAAVDRDLLAGDLSRPPRRRGRRPARRPRRARPSGQRGARRSSRSRTSAGIACDPLGCDQPGQDRVGGDPPARVLGGDRLHHPEQARLRGRVGDLARAAGLGGAQEITTIRPQRALAHPAVGRPGRPGRRRSG